MISPSIFIDVKQEKRENQGLGTHKVICIMEGPQLKNNISNLGFMFVSNRKVLQNKNGLHFI